MTMRTAEILRKTAETDIMLTLDLDGNGVSQIQTGVGFLDHMMTLFAAHGKIDLTLTCNGDTAGDDHHSAEDIRICRGMAFAKALGEKRGINRYGSFLLPMDEALIQTAVDISGRSHLSYGLEIPTEKIGSFDSELVEEFWLAFVRQCPLSLHIRQLGGKNSHHIVEGCFKSVARSLRFAVASAGPNDIPSSKGVL